MSICLGNGLATLFNDDCLAVLKNMPDESVDLIVTDPPYFRVLDEQWDRQWKTEHDFLTWLENVVIEMERVLKPEGSMYLFCSPGLSSETELLIKRHMNVLNNIRWVKPSGRFNGADKSKLRRYFNQSEAIIFAEKTSAGKGVRKADEVLKRQVFNPVIEYFIQAKDALGITSKEIDTATGTHMSRHWFSYSQWSLPTEKHYKTLQQLFAKKAKQKRLLKTHKTLIKEYTGLLEDYRILKAKVKKLRRPFKVSKETYFTDIWVAPSVQYYEGKHPCEKPRKIIEHMILASSQPGQIVGDFFLGSGVIGDVAVSNGRKFIGCEMDSQSFDKSRIRILSKL